MAPPKGADALRVPDPVAVVLQKLHPTIKSHLRSGLRTIIEYPNAEKALRDDLQGLRSYRVKRYRIVYRIEPEKRHIEIVAIGPRPVIYEETFRLLSREKNPFYGRALHPLVPLVPFDSAPFDRAPFDSAPDKQDKRDKRGTSVFVTPWRDCAGKGGRKRIQTGVPVWRLGVNS